MRKTKTISRPAAAVAVAVSLLALAALLFWLCRTTPRRVRPAATDDQEDAPAPGTCGAREDGGIDPVTDPEYNMVQVAKQCVLLEEHLQCPNKRCPDCIKKHFLHICGLAEEAVSLCKRDDPYIQSVPPVCNRVFDSWRDGSATPEECARELRQVRKAIMQRYL